MTLTVGEPLWLDGHFKRLAAQDDLGIETQGARLLRLLSPGIVETSVSAGYYSFYPFLLDEFAKISDDDATRSDFRPFYRHHEAAFAVACSQHIHRGPLIGISGINRCGVAGAEAGDEGLVNVASLAAPEVYMKSGLGGYGLFYRPALEEIGLTRLGAGDLLDRLTPLGEMAAAGVRAVIETTAYWREYREQDEVPMPVLTELAAVLCPCLLPGRADHEPLVNVFFRDQGKSDSWSQARRYRAMSLSLMLEFHADRPADYAGMESWRKSLLSGFLQDTEWQTEFLRHRDAWRAYQSRETLVAALAVLWTSFLQRLQDWDLAYRGEIRDELVGLIDWASLGLTDESTVGDLIAHGAEAYAADPSRLIDSVNSAMKAVRSGDLSKALTLSVSVLGWVGTGSDGDDDFRSLLDSGGSGQLSFEHMSQWIAARSLNGVAEFAGELIDRLVFRHLRVATHKLSQTDKRDPFCLSQDEAGRLRVIRPDEPFWTGARWSTLNHLLWTLGAIDSPSGDGRPTELGLELLAEVRASV